MEFCPVCGREVVLEDGAFAIHYNSGLLRCPTSGQPAGNPDVPDDQVTVTEEDLEPPKRKAPAKRATKKPAK